ncbi:outer membrane receptor for ferrienterochelin and colicin [Luteibacter sp. Sphag1AF]|uniref:TonB-dependent receptor plug domain-containing protein n=1 Tax=Luteibacter sp. Sphag1AF TaxID=2587031 RepID=UPI001618A207|nr:TonB-dependent receptor plug domain-containing protein [Luteibacter sp. Sphag1AF]MBB3225955.1 outer membrane receptor for ferrienterochelin and colicin [Luteibacter sp. Sphag1AF]
MNKKLLTRRHALALAVATCLGVATGAYAQSTTGNLYGTAPVGAGETVLIESSTGLKREVPVDAMGKYVASQLPLGTYTITLRRDGAAIDSRKDVQLRVGSSTDVSFAVAATSSTDATDLGGVTVTSNSLPAIDVTSVDSRTVITSQQLARLPLGRNAEAIAKLAPGVVANTGGFTSDTGRSLVSFGGSAASENAYYVNGFNVTDPLNGAGGLQLPYGAIDQQEVYTGGYSAQYGRSDGGVINQVGKRGTNDWHFGAQVLWEPAFARSNYRDYYYTSTPKSAVAGNLYDPRSENSEWTTTVSAYAGGPLIKDKLFVFVAAEAERRQGSNVNAVDNTATPSSDYRYNSPRMYAKIDWNITDSHILELTGASDKRSGSGSRYAYDFVNRERGAYLKPLNDTKTGGDLYVAKYTGYITDDLTVSAMYGEMNTKNRDVPGTYDPSLTYVSGITSQNPLLNGGSPRGNSQVANLADPARGNKTQNFRFDLAYHLGNHTISVGVDNQKSQANNQGTRTSGPGYSWAYRRTDTPNTPISDGGPGNPNNVPAPAGFPGGETGYYVYQDIANNAVSVRSEQRAQYIEDKWQVSDRWLLSLGLRNDQFTDYNPAGQAFIRQTKPQWAPRLGASWDVNGDGSFKVFANAGRYYLGLPLNPATGAAAGYIATQQYFTYTGIAADGTPTGLTPISGLVSANNSYGVQPDPRTVTAANLKAEHQDEFILGFDKTLGTDYVWGMKATQRILRAAIDDFCDIGRVTAKAEALGYTVGSTNSCYLIDGGAANTFVLLDTSGNPFRVPLSREELGFPQLKRRYYGLETFLEHPFNGKWYGKIDYVFSRSYGNTEGQLRSDLRQNGASASEDWDNYAIMVNANGVQNNDHTHVLKAYGYYQVAPEWQVSGNFSAQSGNPRICLGYFGADHSNPTGYNNAYHFCNGEPSPPGSQGRLPWTFQLDLGVTYRPNWGDQKLAFSANVFNVLNEQRATFLQPNGEGDSPRTVNPQYGMPLLSEAPRYVRFSVNYDF